eukprot:m.160282 g.160282  ORF g.160282 m.160282 type:complete len:570 (-) comp17053_c0_seq16:332-2041(-)
MMMVLLLQLTLLMIIETIYQRTYPAVKTVASSVLLLLLLPLLQLSFNLHQPFPFSFFLFLISLSLLLFPFLEGNRFWLLLMHLSALLLAAGTTDIELPIHDRVPLFREMCKKDCPTLFIREVYKALFPVTMDFMRRETGGNMIFVGNPGIGKTRFMMYTIIRAVAEGWTSIVVDAPALLGNRVFVIEPHGVVVRRRDEHEVQDHSLYLFDAAGDSVRDRPLSAKHEVIYSSPDVESYKSATKIPNTLIYIIPPFSREEIHSLQQLSFFRDRKDVDALYDIYGGIPRTVLKLQQAGPESHREEVALKLKDAVEKGSFMGLQNEMIFDRTKTSHSLIHIYPMDNNPGKPLVRMASPFVAECLVQSLMAYQQQLTRLFLSLSEVPSMAAFRGQIFEAHVKSLLAKGGSFIVRRLEPGAAAETLVIPASPMHLFGPSAADLTRAVNRHSGANMCFWPTVLNFESIDAVLQTVRASLVCWSALQCTVSQQHSIKGWGLAAVLDALGLTAGIFRFYFLVPSDRFNDFTKPQPYYTAGNKVFVGPLPWTTSSRAVTVEQWVMEIPTPPEYPPKFFL